VESLISRNLNQKEIQMQKKLIAVAVAGLVSGAAFAQSNVTVYGVADAYFASVKVTDQKRYYAVNSGGLSGSRIGFKAVEDLGNGTSALAVIEYGFKIDEGTNVASASGGSADTGLVARQKLVGLTGGWGTAVAGYAQTAGYDFACATNGFGGSALDPEGSVGVGVLLSCGNNGRAGNALAYISPNFGGFTAAYNHSRVTEGAGAAAQKGDVTANLLAGTYTGGPVTVNAVYSKVSDSDNLAPTLVGKSLKEFGIRGSFNFGFATAFASYQTEDKETVDNKNKSYNLGVAVPVGPAGTIVADYARATIKEGVTTNLNKKDAYAIAYLHALSKRTTAYAGYNRKNDKTVDPTVKTDTLAVGLRHTF
jgi:general bacterial porin, GBP family